MLKTGSLAVLDSMGDIFQINIRGYLSNISDDISIKTFKLPIESLIEKGKLYVNTKIHLKTIESIINNIIDESYPDKITPESVWGIFYQKGKSDISLNDFGKKQLSREEEINEYYLDKIFEEADVLLNKSWDKHITKSGNATSPLYSTVHRKLQDVKQNGQYIKRPSVWTVRNRLDGYLQNKLK